MDYLFNPPEGPVARTTGGVTNNYTYDGSSQILANGMSTLRAPGLDEAYAQITAGTAVSYLRDANGSVAALTNAAQATVQPRRPVKAEQRRPSLHFSTRGADYDSSDQLLYLRNRFYSLPLARFVTEDPSHLGGGLNVYAYVGGDPISSIDPWGLLATVAVSGNEVAITLPISYSGPGAAPGRVAEWNNTITKTGSGQFGRYHVTTTVTHGPDNQISVPCDYGPGRNQRSAGNRNMAGFRN